MYNNCLSQDDNHSGGPSTAVPQALNISYMKDGSFCSCFSIVRLIGHQLLLSLHVLSFADQRGGIGI